MKMKTVFAIGALFLSQASWADNYALKVTERGFEPETLNVPAGEDVSLKVTRITDATCAKQIIVPSKKLKADLPLNKEVTLSLGKLSQGEIKFACRMMMMSGVIIAR